MKHKLFWKITVRLFARKDAKGEYGVKMRTWLNQQSGTDGGKQVDFPISYYMTQRLIKYEQHYIQTIRRFKKKTKKLYGSLLDQYQQYKDVKVIIESAKQTYEADMSGFAAALSKKSAELAEKEKHYHEVNRTDIIEPEMGANSIYELHTQKLSLETEISDLEQKQSDIRERRIKHEGLLGGQLSNKKNELIKTLAHYRNELGIFYAGTGVMEKVYNEEVSYYLYVLGQRMGIGTSVIHMKDIYDQQGFPLRAEDKGLKGELDFLNVLQNELGM